MTQTPFFFRFAVCVCHCSLRCLRKLMQGVVGSMAQVGCLPDIAEQTQ